MKKLRVGDLVFKDARSKFNIVGRMIQTVENDGVYPEYEYCPYHVGIVCKEAENIKDVKVMNMFISGATLQPLGKWIDNPNINVVVRTYSDFIPEYKRRKMKYWLYKIYKNKTRYDWISIIGIYVKYLILKKVDNKILRWVIRYVLNDNIESKQMLNCCELIRDAYKNISINLISIFPDYLYPSDLYNTHNFRTIYRHYNFEYPDPKMDTIEKGARLW